MEPWLHLLFTARTPWQEGQARLLCPPVLGTPRRTQKAEEVFSQHSKLVWGSEEVAQDKLVQFEHTSVFRCYQSLLLLSVPS